jgi:aldose sugar dehydrogenase
MKKRLWPAIAIGITMVYAGCAPQTSSEIPAQAAPAAEKSQPAKSTVAQNADAKSVKWEAKTVLDGLDHPWSIAWLPDGAMLITERRGTLRIARDGKLLPENIKGVPRVFASGQGGLMDIALHPDFAKNRQVYLTYSAGDENSNHTELARGVLQNNELRDVQTIFRVAQNKSGGQHFGSRLAWLPDGTLLMSIGDGGNPPVKLGDDFIRKQAQNKGAHLGKILRLNDDGTPAKDNPFRNTTGAAPEVWSLGHRNIQGLTVDAQGRVWANEHGARGGDELNLIRAGKNYGWPLVTHSVEYWGPKISDEKSRPGLEDPKLVWDQTQAPSGLLYYSGDKIPAWKGQLFSGSLAGQQIRRVSIDKNGNVTSDEAMPMGARVRDVRQGPDGYIYVLTDENRGKLLRIESE